MPQKSPPKPKIIALVGPTASGKSEIAVELAKKYDGEVLSVDSRQIYRGMDLGTGKVKGKWKTGAGKKVFVYKGVAHYGIDIASPKRQYSVAQFQTYSRRAIADMLKRGKLPILCGGTAHWLDAVVYEQKFPAVKPDAALRKRLYKLSAAQLFARLQELDPERAANIDAHNPRRLVRALEIVSATGKAIPKMAHESPYQILWLGIKTDPAELQKKINRRLAQRVKNGMFHEIKTLHKQAISWQKLWNFGLEYRYGSLYCQNKLSKQEALEQLATAIYQYSKRQLTWWKRNKDINWI
jgi:tRNA dimethylallyltransferase